jgi:ubiquinone/menaquinone biosynthesis C-methylase UbiE
MSRFAAIRDAFGAAGASVGIVCASAILVAGQGAHHVRLFPPEDLGQLEGPDRDAWQQPGQVMDALGIADGAHVADIGAGGGWFTIRIARRVGPRGRVYAEDVQPQMIEAITRRVQREGLRNVEARVGDDADPRLSANSLDAALIVDAYHEVQRPVTLLSNIRTALKPNGRLGIVNFRKDGVGPGPPLDQRVDPDDVRRDAEAAGLRLVAHETFLPFQYLLIFGKS